MSSVVATVGAASLGDRSPVEGRANYPSSSSGDGNNNNKDGEETVVLKGFLKKRGYHRKNWLTRWCELTTDELRYYTDENRREVKGD